MGEMNRDWVDLFSEEQVSCGEIAIRPRINTGHRLARFGRAQGIAKLTVLDACPGRAGSTRCLAAILPLRPIG